MRPEKIHHPRHYRSPGSVHSEHQQSSSVESGSRVYFPCLRHSGGALWSARRLSDALGTRRLRILLSTPVRHLESQVLVQPGRGLARRAGPILDLISISARVRVAPAFSCPACSTATAAPREACRSPSRSVAARLRSCDCGRGLICGTAAAVGRGGRILAALLQDLYGSLAAYAGRIRLASQNGFAPVGTWNPEPGLEIPLLRFPNMRVVHVVRDPLTYIRSSINFRLRISPNGLRHGWFSIWWSRWSSAGTSCPPSRSRRNEGALAAEGDEAPGSTASLARTSTEAGRGA